MRYALGMSGTRNNRQIWITRSHLMALGIATSCIALLAFLVGLQVGRSQAASAEVASTAPLPLTPDTTQEEALEALLREVEMARATVGPNLDGGSTPSAEVSLSFPELLQPDAPELGLPDGDAAAAGASVATADPAAAPTPPAGGGAEGAVPQSGWSVQVASYPTLSEADAALASLAADGHEAYRVAALVDGQNWYRVRIGGFSSKTRAESMRRELQEKLGSTDLILAEAP